MDWISPGGVKYRAPYGANKGSYPLPCWVFFYTLGEGGEGGGSNPCVKIYVADLYNSGGFLAT